MDHTQPKKIIQDVAKTYKEDNTVIQQYNPQQNLTKPYNTIQYKGKLNRAVHDHSGLHKTERVLANKFLFAGGPPANNFLFAGGPPANNFLFAGGPPANKFLFAKGPPGNNLFLFLKQVRISPENKTGKCLSN